MVYRSTNLTWAWKDPDGKQDYSHAKKRKRKRGKRHAKRERFLYARGDDFYDSKRWLSLRMKVLEHYGRQCMKCLRVDGEMHVDHIKPRSRFPELSLTFENLQVLCRDCNLEKLNYHATDYREEAVCRMLDAGVDLSWL